MDFSFNLESWQHLTSTQWFLASLAAFLLGFAKAGIKGLGTLTMTIMALVFGGKASTGIVIPLLIMGDIFAVIYYKRSVRWSYLFKFVPWVFVGVLIGVLVGKDLPERLFQQGMSVIILFSVIMMYAWELRSSIRVPNQWWFAGLMGLGTGFTTMIGNLAGAFSNLFFLAMRLPKMEFIGTVAFLYFFTNLFKLPFHIWVWETIQADSLAVNLRLMIPMGLGLFFGVKLIKFIPENGFRKMILILTALGALLILYKSFYAI